MMDSASASHTGSPKEQETTLFQAEGVLVTSQRLVTDGRTWLLGDVERVEAVHRAPRVLPLLVTLSLGVVLGLPVLHAAMAAPGAQGKGAYGAAMGLAGLAIFGSIAGLLWAEDTYWLVLWTRQHGRRVFRSRDHRLVSRLAVLVTEAAVAARQRSGSVTPSGWR